MSSWILVLSVGRLLDVLITGLGAVAFQARVAVACSLIAFVLKLLLAPTFHVAGILFATSCAYAVVGIPIYLWWMIAWFRQTPANPAAKSRIAEHFQGSVAAS